VAKTSLKKPSIGKKPQAGKAKTAGKKKQARAPAARSKTPAKKGKAVAAARPAAARPAPARRVNGNPKGKPSRAAIQKSAPPARAQAPTPPPAAAPENGKPRKNAAGFSPRDLEHFRELLLAKRRELLGDLRSMEHEALHSGGGSNLSNLPIHMADMGTDNYEQEFTLGLVEKDRTILREINAALLKMQSGSYGICEGTGKPINRERLEYQPWARYSIEYARKLERAGRPGIL
jgi:DnaK suppressor protein